MLESRIALFCRSQLLCATALLALGCERKPASTAGSTHVCRVEVTIVEEVGVAGPAATEEIAPWRDRERMLLLLDGTAAAERRQSQGPASAIPCCITPGRFTRGEPRRLRTTWRARRVRIVAEVQVPKRRRQRRSQE
jgi:hypothetical protein